MQYDPFLEQIDWVFTSTNWIFDYPNTLLLPMARPTSDHIPVKFKLAPTSPKLKLSDSKTFGLITLGSWKLSIRSGLQMLDPQTVPQESSQNSSFLELP
jgi:hypothetical protein